MMWIKIAIIIPFFILLYVNYRAFILNNEKKIKFFNRFHIVIGCIKLNLKNSNDDFFFNCKYKRV